MRSHNKATTNIYDEKKEHPQAEQMFREQVNRLSLWFEQWNECEQTVALYSLLKRLSPQQARFCSLVLEQCLSDCTELQQQEQRANNPAFVSSLLGESGREGSLPVSPLLNHLLLLRPGNADAKACYLSLIPRVLGAAVETGINIEAARQLLSYSLIHPAISTDDRRVLTQWLRHLEDRISNPAPVITQHEQTNNWDTMGSNPNGHNGHVGFLSDCQPRVRRSNSLTPPVSIPQATDLSSSQDDLCHRPKPRSFSLSSEHAPLSPQSSLASSGSGSESHLDELRSHNNSFNSETSGMKDVPAWLKSLRLHKYAWLFASMTYEEMLGLSEESLESRGVTKGARHKIVLSVRKLKERFSTMAQLEQDVVKGGSLRSALEELRSILVTPIKIPEQDCAEQDDLPRQFTKVLGKVCTQLLVSGQADEEAVGMFHSLLDRCLTHEAFTPHRSRINTWRQQLMQVWPPLGTLHEQPRIAPPRKWSHPPFPNGLNTECLGRGRPLQAPASRFSQNGCRPGQGSPPVLASSFPVGAGSLLSSMHRSGLPGDSTNSSASFFAKRPSLQDSLAEPLQSHLWMQRTRSAPPKPNQFCGIAAFGKVSPSPEPEPEINLRLESLCLSMTEHALGGTGLGEL